jgi:hypothetical protein
MGSASIPAGSDRLGVGTVFRDNLRGGEDRRTVILSAAKDLSISQEKGSVDLKNGSALHLLKTTGTTSFSGT